MRYNKKYSMTIGLVLIFLYFLTDVISYLNGGFIFVDNTDLSRYNIVITFVMDVGVIALFALANWLMSTFFEGKGRLKETWIYLSLCHTAGNILQSSVCTFIQCADFGRRRVPYLYRHYFPGLDDYHDDLCVAGTAHV